MNSNITPERWAFDLTKVLNQVLGPEHFPIDVIDLALEYTARRFPGDPITLAKGANLPGFEGALYRAPAGRRGWGIVYNDALTSRDGSTSRSRTNSGITCCIAQPIRTASNAAPRTWPRWDSPYALIEQQANTFAANLLMPLDDFRRQIEPRARSIST